MQSNFNTGTKAFEEASAQFAKIGITAEDLPDQLTAGLASGLADKLSVVAANHGNAMAQEVLGMYNGIVDGLSTEQVEQFTSYMNEVDWSNAD